MRSTDHKITAVKVFVVCCYLTIKPSEIIMIALYLISRQATTDSHYVAYRLSNRLLMINTYFSTFSKQVVYQYRSNILVVHIFTP